ncbi:hypothetical protein VNO78_30431 [Psophocarpus tetragonolobus]|uniref:50S ribosomal protein L33, chloroplastic n=1 Tax=Psophocarpus tetragonolobus TaxID=3891 RepID=A0AAN9RWK8_PSOTE
MACLKSYPCSSEIRNPNPLKWNIKALDSLASDLLSGQKRTQLYLCNAFGMGDKKKKAQMFIKLVSAAGTGFFYVKRKPRQFTEKLEFRKYDPRVNRHVLFTEAKIK